MECLGEVVLDVGWCVVGCVHVDGKACDLALWNTRERYKNPNETTKARHGPEVKIVEWMRTGMGIDLAILH